MKQSYYKSFPVPEAACDADGYCRPSFFAVCMENIAREDSIRLGQGADILRAKYNAGWMILFAQMTLRRPVRAGQTLQALTWTRGVKGASVLRDYIFFIDGGELLRATQQWVVVEMTKRILLNPHRLPELAATCPSYALSERPERVPDFSFDTEAVPQTVSAMEIDANGHMNNACYLRRAEALLPPDRLQRPYRLQFEYRSELMQGQSFDVLHSATDNTACVVFRRDGHICFSLYSEDIVQQR